MAGSKNSRNVAVIGGGVGVAAAAVITLLVVKGKPADDETTELSARAAALPELGKQQLEGGVVKPWEAKTPTPEELKQAAADRKVQQEEIEKEAAMAEAEVQRATAVEARRQAIEQARNAGIIGGTAALQAGGAFASLTGTGDISSGFDDANIYGGLVGSDINAGFGRSGFGPGGGGTGWGTIGTGRYGTIGRGSGTGRGVGGGRSTTPSVSIGQPNATGDLDKAIIRRYIKRNIQKIQYCYEKELVANPKLAGVITVKFTISANGTVDNAGATGVDPKASSCIADVVKGIEFPKPKGGGVVNVTYPFTFRPAGTP